MKTKKPATETPSKEILEFGFEVKQVEEDTGDGFFRFEGMASTYGNLDHNLDIVEPGAFTKSLQRETPVILWQHKQNDPIGVPELIEDRPEGLFIRAKLPLDDDLVRGRVVPQIKVGSVRTMSIGFKAMDWVLDDNGIRYLKELIVPEISLVTRPCNDEARITGFKSREDINPITLGDLEFLDDLQDSEFSVRDLEKKLRDSGLFSGQAAVKLSSILTRETLEKKKQSELAEEVKALVSEMEKKKLECELSTLTKSFTKGNK